MYPTSAREREHHYRVLASLYLRPPSDALLGMIRDGSILSAFAVTPGGEDPVSCGDRPTPLADLEEFVTQARGLPDLEAELAAEQTALFVLPSGVIPHEAFYLDSEQRLGGRVTIAVEQFYTKAGISMLDHCVEMPDHLGLELEFMAALCRLEGDFEEAPDPEALQRCVELQRTFVGEHLARWAPACCENVIRQTRYGLYRAIADFTREFVQGERIHLAVRRAQAAGPAELSP